MNFDFLEELYVFNSKSNYVPREMYEKAQALADKRLELLRRATTGQSYCFICGRYLIPPMIKQDLEVGHLPDCELAEAIDASA